MEEIDILDTPSQDRIRQYNIGIILFFSFLISSALEFLIIWIFPLYHENTAPGISGHLRLILRYILNDKIAQGLILLIAFFFLRHSKVGLFYLFTPLLFALIFGVLFYILSFFRWNRILDLIEFKDHYLNIAMHVSHGVLFGAYWGCYFIIIHVLLWKRKGKLSLEKTK